MKIVLLWNFLKRNWDTVLTMVIAAPIAFFNYFQTVEPQIVSTAILSVLFLIACGLLVNRETNNRLQQTTEKILGRMQKPPIEEVLVPYKTWMDDIEANLATAKEVWVLSRTCTRFWEDYKEKLEGLLDRKGSIRLMLVDPRDGALQMLANSVELARAKELPGRYTRVSVENASNRLVQLRKQVEDFIHDMTTLSLHLGKKRLELRTVDYLPAHTLLIINGSSEYATIFVELGTFNANGRNRPTFSLYKDRNLSLFRIYYDEYQVMWDTAYSMDDFLLKKNEV